ncbi:hypothetical protein GTQ40_14735 [Flavobacteriaceae bacterium R38]|nr:hypothetical protein [Flavobacteriaceae bacterium R38]
MKKLQLVVTVILIIVFSSCQTNRKISRFWTSFTQSVDIESNSKKKFKVIASVKVETNDPQARAGIWVRVDNHKGMGFFENMENRPITSNTWESYTIEGFIDSQAKRINIGGLCYFNGKFYFDKFELYLENDKGIYELIDLPNSSFESNIVNNVIPGWNQGVSKNQITNIEGFTFTSNSDHIDGSHSILVTGTGITNDVVKLDVIKQAFPNLGIYISIVFILILLFSLITNHTSPSGPTWSNPGLIGFRFSFIYFLFFIIVNNNGAYPFFNFIIQKPSALLHEFALWFGKNILQIPYKIAIGPNGSGDTTYHYILVFMGFLLAVLGTVIWSVIDKKRTHYIKLYYWLTTAIRYYVGLILINYGMAKVIQLQFSSPDLYRLIQPYGDSSPMALAWTFLGFSEGYNLFMGIAEVLAGLLLFRRTQTLGAIITLMVAMNVMAINYFYDVPVKILSTHLVIMTLFLLSRDLKRVLLFLVTNKPVEQLSIIEQPKFKKGLNISLKVIKGLIVFYAFGYGFFDSLSAKKIYGADAPKPDLYGVYEVTNLVINNDTITNYKSDRLWKYIIFEDEGVIRVDKMNKSRRFYSVEVDSKAQKIKFYPSRNNANDYFNFNYTKTDSTLVFDYIYKNDTISGQTKRLGKDDFLLTGRGFNWISERPFNNR